jgi:hypothetical protein
MMTILAVGWGGINSVPKYCPQISKKVYCSRHFNFAKHQLPHNKSTSTNKAGRLRSGLTSGRQGRRASLNRSARFNRHVFVVANNMTNINERTRSMRNYNEVNGQKPIFFAYAP